MRIGPDLAGRAFRRARSVAVRKLRYAGRLLGPRPLTRAAVAHDLRRALGIQPGDVVMVHSSLGRLGWVAGGARTVIEAFIEVLTPDGTLVMPTYSGRGSMLRTLESGAVFDLRRTPSRVGAITEAFRTWPGVRRSLHPTSSVTAWGRQAQLVTTGHESGELMAGPGSPFARLLELDARYVGLGVDLSIVSLYHVLEDTWDGFPFEVHGDRVFAAPVVDEQGVRRTVRVRPLDPARARTRIDQPSASALRARFHEHFRSQGILREGRVGRAPSWSFCCRPFFAELKRLAGRGITIYGWPDRVRLDNDCGCP